MPPQAASARLLSVLPLLLLPSQYLEQVQARHPGLLAARADSRAALLGAREHDLALSTHFSLELMHSSDSEPQITQFAPSATRATGVSLELQRAFASGLPGLEARVSWLFNRVSLDVPPQGAPAFLFSEYYDAWPTIGLTLPLGARSWGNRLISTRNAGIADARARHHSSESAAQQIQLDASLAYWRHSCAASRVELLEDFVERSKNRVDWVMRRRKARLSDSADLAQARAQLELRQVELEEARSRLRTARLEFWSLAGEDPPRDPENPRLLELEKAETPGPADAPPARLVQGLAALRETADALEQKARLGGDGLRTTVDLFAELGLKGRGATPADALARSLSLVRKELVFGVRIEAPLDLDARRTATLGHVHAREAAQARYERQRRESDDDLALLRERLSDSGRRVALLVRLEQTQLEKLELEQQKLRQGRSTTYRIIEIEDELASSRIRLLETRLEQMEAGLRLSSFSQTPTEG